MWRPFQHTEVGEPQHGISPRISLALRHLMPASSSNVERSLLQDWKVVRLEFVSGGMCLMSFVQKVTAVLYACHIIPSVFKA